LSPFCLTQTPIIEYQMDTISASVVSLITGVDRSLMIKFPKTAASASPSLTDWAYREIRQSIITGRVPGGSRLVETALASQMNVSRTPVREALHKLALEGLLYSIPRAGYIVEELSDHDIQDLLTTRTAIEQIIIRWAIEKISAEEIERLEANLQKTAEALESDSLKTMMDLDAEFHQIIYKAARSKTLFRISQMLSDHTLKFRMACIHIPEIARRAREGHLEIFRALQAKDAKRAEEAVRSHLEIVQKDVLGYLQQARQESFVTGETAF